VPSSNYLTIYLTDHHAAGSAGARLAERAAQNVSPSVEGQAELPRIAGEIAADLGTLEEIMLGAGIEPSRLKVAAAITLERLGRLKPNGHLRRRSPLSDVLELEALMVGIRAKAALWQSLANALPESGVDFDALQERAAGQFDVVSRCRDSAAQRAFSA
jgi:hypothetical protein